MRRSNLTSLSTISPEPVVLSLPDSEARELERWWVQEWSARLARRLEGVGLREPVVQGSSEQGWTLEALLGSGQAVQVHLDTSDLYGIPAGDDWLDRAMELGAQRLIDEADRVAHPPDPPSEGPLVGTDGTGVQLGVEILDRLGQSGLDRVNAAVRGESD